MTEKNSDAIDWRTILQRKLRLTLWKHIDQRLHRADMPITVDYFLEVMQGEPSTLANVAPPTEIPYAIRAMVHRINQEHPSKYLIFDIKYDT